MSIVVTGGAGFIGSHVVDLLVRDNFDVIVIDNLSHGNEEDVNPKARFYRLDINSRKVEGIFKKDGVDGVIHLAAHINARAKEPFFDAKTNIIGSLNLLELCRKYNVGKFVYASSVAVYGEPRYLPCDELHPLNPINNYGISKHTVEHYLYSYFTVYGLRYNILRYSNVYGPRQDGKGEGGVVSVFINNILGKKPVFVFGDGEQTRDFVFVGDVAKATLMAMKVDSSRNIMNIGTGKEISVNGLFEMIRKMFRGRIRCKHIEGIPYEIRRMSVDGSIAEKELSLSYTPLEKGLGMTLDYYKRLY